MEKTKICITGAAGFIGHHVVEHILKNTDWDIIVLDKLNYASMGLDRLRDVECFDEGRVKFFSTELCQPLNDGLKNEIGEVDYIINMASESHVDNSINDPVPFIQNNVNLTLYMLEWARQLKSLKKFIQFSTDEVMGPAPEGVDFKEDGVFNPSNPYSASKAAQEAICMSYANTYNVPLVITRTMNVIGERQHPQKYVPLVIKCLLNGDLLKIHSNPELTKAGSRKYIHARNVASALMFIINNTNELVNKENIKSGKFNIVGEVELDNLTLAKIIEEEVKKYENVNLNYELVDFHSSRQGHDPRYSLDGSKLKELGFEYPKTFNESLTKTIKWTLENRKWLGLTIN